MQHSPVPVVPAARSASATLLRLDRDAAHRASPSPLLVVPSPLTRFTVLDAPHGSSLLRALRCVSSNLYCLDWGVTPFDDASADWAAWVHRVAWATSIVRRETRAASVGLLGYSLGGTLSVIHAALHPDETRLLVNLAGPVDFARAGVAAWLAGPRWFFPEVPAALAALIPPRAGAERTPRPLLSWLEAFGPAFEATAPAQYEWLALFSTDPTPCPRRAYLEYIRHLVQRNELALGMHVIDSTTVDLRQITCPLLTIAARHDLLCAPPAASALPSLCNSLDATTLTIPGGHIGSVVGRHAPERLHRPLLDWLRNRL